GPRSRHRVLGLILLVAVLSLLVVVAAWRWRTSAQTTLRNASDTGGALSSQRSALSAPADPRLTFTTPYRNVRPGVRYVGDETCARCHAQLARSYRQHPMGRSLPPMSAVSPSEQERRVAELARVPADPSEVWPLRLRPSADFRAGGFHYRIEQR